MLKAFFGKNIPYKNHVAIKPESPVIVGDYYRGAILSPVLKGKKTVLNIGSNLCMRIRERDTNDPAHDALYCQRAKTCKKNTIKMVCAQIALLAVKTQGVRQGPARSGRHGYNEKVFECLMLAHPLI